jgi:hypothetical protein
MKKILSILLILALFCGCASKQEEVVDEDVDLSSTKILCPAGAPALAFYKEAANENFSTGDASSILPELKGSGDVDIIVIDTVNGIKALNAGANYKLAATLTFGNFYIVSTGHDDDGVMDADDYIVVFSQGATPDLVFHYLYGDQYDAGIHYVQAVSDASVCAIKGINIADDSHSADEDPYVDYVMIAEPALSAAMSKNENLSVYANVQDLYAEKSNGLSMIQASVFVSNNYAYGKEFLSQLESDINEVLANPDLFSSAISDAGLGDDEFKDLFGVANVNLATKVLTSNSIGLGFKMAYDNKEAIDNFVSLFDLGTTSEEIYFQ